MMVVVNEIVNEKSQTISLAILSPTDRGRLKRSTNGLYKEINGFGFAQK